MMMFFLCCWIVLLNEVVFGLILWIVIVFG